MKSWKTWLPWTLLALSVALNIFFVGGFSGRTSMRWAGGAGRRRGWNGLPTGSIWHRRNARS